MVTGGARRRCRSIPDFLPTFQCRLGKRRHEEEPFFHWEKYAEKRKTFRESNLKCRTYLASKPPKKRTHPGAKYLAQKSHQHEREEGSRIRKLKRAFLTRAAQQNSATHPSTLRKRTDIKSYAVGRVGDAGFSSSKRT